MSVEAARQRLRDANPVPNPASLRHQTIDPAVFLTAIEQRSTTMHTDHQLARTERTSNGRGPWLAAAAVALILVVAGGVLLLMRAGGENNVADQPATAEEIARTLIEFRTTEDADAAVALLAADATIEHGVVSDVAEFASFLRWQVAIGSEQNVTECNETPMEDGASIRCGYTHSNAWARALETGPYEGSSLELVIVDEKVQSLTNSFLSGAFDVEAWTPFRFWVVANHRNDMSTMYVGNDPVLTSESIALWERYTAEFVASLSGDATP